MNFWDTPEKDIPRQVVMTRRPLRRKRVNRARTASTALTLPAEKMLCVKAGIDSGIFNQHTLHIFVEQKPKVQRNIARQMSKLNCEWEPRFWRDDLHKLPLRSLLGNDTLDFAYLDLCAAMNPENARWIYTELGPALSEGATVAITVSRNWRRSAYMRWVTQSRRALRPYLREAERRIYDADCCGKVGDLSGYYDDSGSQMTDSFMLPRQGGSKWNRFMLPEYHDTSVDALAGIMLLFPWHDFRLEACVEYQRDGARSTRMTTFVITDFERLAVPWISQHHMKMTGQQMRPTLRPVSLPG